MKIGVEISIDVKKIEKARLYQGQKGTYLTMTAFIDIDNKDQYDNNGMVVHKKEKDETGQTPILGNCKVFWNDSGNAQQNPQHSNTNAPAPRGAAPSRPNAPIVAPYANDEDPELDSFEDDIPF